MRVPVYVHGSISCEDIERAFAVIGVHVRSEDGRLVADPIPSFLRKEEPTNVRRLPTKLRKVNP